MASIDGNKIIDEIKAKRSKTPRNSGSITTNGKVLASVQDSIPAVGRDAPPEPMTNNQKFLQQIEDYNDFIVQNDLDAEMINPDHDYDFTAFASPEDWKIESQRLKDRLSDRQTEIEQTATDGEFAGLELEGGVPSYEAVDNMSDEEFSNYERKYLLSDLKELAPNDNTPEKTIIDTPTEPMVHTSNKTKAQPAAISVTHNNSLPTPSDSNLTNMKIQALEKARANHTKSQRSVTDTLTSVLPAPIKYSLQNSLDAFRSASKIKDQADKHGVIPTLRDAGRGVTAGIYDSADVITSFGGLVPNSVSKLAGGIADNIRASNEIPNSEVERVSELGSESVAGGIVGGVAGSKIGRALGSKYKSMKQDAEKFDQRIAKLAEEQAKMVMNNPAFKKSLKHQAQLVKQKTYENMTAVPKSKPWTSIDGVSHNIKRLFGDRAMLSKNTDELGRLYEQTGNLNKARQSQRDAWNKLDDDGMKLGIGAGLGAGSVFGRNKNDEYGSEI